MTATTSETIAAIESLCRQGLGDRPIARRLDCSVHSVRKYRPTDCLTEKQLEFRAKMSDRYWYNGRKHSDHAPREDKLLAALVAVHGPRGQ